MKAWEVFSHSVRLVWRNRRDALRISVALYAIYALVQRCFWRTNLPVPTKLSK